MIDRRQLLSGAMLSPLVISGRAFAVEQAAKAKLLVVLLRGAYDAMNIVVPISSSFYYESRPTIAIAKPSAGDASAAISLDGDWGLHPSLAESLQPFWAKRQLAFVPFAGTDDLSRSHFKTQDTIELGQPLSGSRDYSSGFMARLASTLQDERPISFTDQLPLCFRGGPVVANAAVTHVQRATISESQRAAIEAMYAGQHLGALDLSASVQTGFEVGDTLQTLVKDEMALASRGATSTKGFELAAQRIARLMRDRYDLAFVDVGGWDTHVRQGGANGYLADRIAELGRGLAAFAQEIGPDAWRDTTVIVLSEFGRTIRENGDRGTDHGHGSVYWVMGGGVNGGRLAGPQVSIAQATLNQDRDLQVLTDYRQLIGGVAARLFGMRPAQIDKVFPGTSAIDLKLV